MALEDWIGLDQRLLLLLNGSFSGIKNCPGGQLCSRHHDVECFLLDFFLHFTTPRAEV